MTVDADRITIKVAVRMKNIGRSLAQHVDCQVMLIPKLILSGTDEQRRLQVWEHQRQWLLDQTPQVGFALFPQDYRDDTLTLGLEMSDLEDAWRKGFPAAMDKPLEERPLPLLLVGHVGYAQPIGQSVMTTSFGHDVLAHDTTPMAKSYPQPALGLKTSQLGLRHAT
jgi:hypothetical protein